MKTIPAGKTDHVVFWVGWVFFGLVLAALLRSAGEISWKHALVLAAALSGMAQVSAMSAGFSCKTTPLTKTPLWRSAVDARDGGGGADVLLGEYWRLCRARV